jgi:hypothetical membrane protein
MNRKLINWLGLTGIVAFISYTLAMFISPSAFPGYNRMEQAVSDLSVESAPSRMLWNQISALYEVGSVVCATCVSIYISDARISTRLFRIGIHLFTIMNWISNVGYAMFPLADSGKEIVSFQEIMHMAVTAAVVLLSISSLVCLIIAGFRSDGIRGIGVWAAVALAMMMVGAIGQATVPPQYFGIVERFSVFAAVGFNAVCGIYLFRGYGRNNTTAFTNSPGME